MSGDSNTIVAFAVVEKDKTERDDCIVINGMPLDKILEQIETGQYDPTISGSTVEFHCIEAEYGVNPEPRDPGEARQAGMRNPTYGRVLSDDELAFSDRPPVKRAMNAGWLLPNPVPTSIRVPDNSDTPLPVTQTEFDHITDYSRSRGIDERFGVAPDRTLWEIHAGWIVDVPDGYSLLFHHPFNYGSKDFRTIPGVVDAQHLPGMLRIPVEITTERGSIRYDEPVAQILPFKRAEQSVEAVVEVVDEGPAETGDTSR